MAESIGRLLRVGAVVALLAPASAAAQVGFMAQGVADLEGWKTDSSSALLARNRGKAAALGRLALWSAVEPWRDVVLFGEVRGETGAGRAEPGSEVYLEQYGARWSPSDAFVLEGGKMAHVVGTFSARHLSFRNPLVGMPDGYSLVYPLGVRVSGTTSIVDYRVAMLSKPLSHEGYTPDPSPAWRPAAGAGVTLFTGFRIGASGTVGPYLDRGLPAALYAGRDWRRFHQRIVAADVQLSRGYFESYGEIAHGSYDVPGRSEAIDGLTWYVETKYTFTPRLYLAVRVEQNDYPFIAPRDTTRWTAERSSFSDVEGGVGFRIAPSTLLKLSLRADHWVPNPNPFAPDASGRALAVQLSQTFDLVELATRRR